MKTEIYTIPIQDAFAEESECPVCRMYQKLEENAINYTIGPGASYMEGDIREQSDEQAYKSMKISYRYRSMAQLLWIVLAMVLPFVNAAAGIIPLFFPSLSIKLINILGIIKAKPNL